MSRRPPSPRRARSLACRSRCSVGRPALAAPAVPEALPEAVRDVIALCLRANQAEWAEMRSEGEPGHAVAREAEDALHLEMELLRSRTLAKSPKTWDDVAVLTVLALYWERGEIKHLVERTEPFEDPEDLLIGCGDRPLPSVFLALVEVLGLRLDLFPPDVDGPLLA